MTTSPQATTENVEGLVASLFTVARNERRAAYPDSHTVEVCERAADHIASLEAQLAEREKECFALAADQCHSGYAGEYGDHCCREQDVLRAETARLSGQIAKARMEVEIVASLPLDNDSNEFPTLKWLKARAAAFLADLPATSVEPERDLPWDAARDPSREEIDARNAEMIAAIPKPTSEEICATPQEVQLSRVADALEQLANSEAGLISERFRQYAEIIRTHDDNVQHCTMLKPASEEVERVIARLEAASTSTSIGVARDAIALIRHLSAESVATSAASAWRPIETAPFETDILISDGKTVWISIQRIGAPFSLRVRGLEHIKGWQPLPPPPTTEPTRGNATTGVEQEDTPDERS